MSTFPATPRRKVWACAAFWSADPLVIAVALCVTVTPVRVPSVGLKKLKTGAAVHSVVDSGWLKVWTSVVDTAEAAVALNAMAVNAMALRIIGRTIFYLYK